MMQQRNGTFTPTPHLHPSPGTIITLERHLRGRNNKHSATNRQQTQNSVRGRSCLSLCSQCREWLSHFSPSSFTPPHCQPNFNSSHFWKTYSYFLLFGYFVLSFCSHSQLLDWIWTCGCQGVGRVLLIAHIYCYLALSSLRRKGSFIIVL